MGFLMKTFPLILFLSFALCGSGCALFVVGGGVAAGVGAAEYIGGELKQDYSAPLEKAWNASLAAVDELEMKTTEKYMDNLDQNRVIKGKTGRGPNFQISLEAQGKEATRVKVRVGTFGDEEYSKKIQESIAGNLKRL
jgi:hypothetical protein